MNFLRSMDLYKAIVLLSLVLLPLGGWWVMRLDSKIVASKKAIDEAKRPGGLIEQIGSLQRKVEVVVQNKRSTSDSINDPRTYFEGQILAAGGSGLKTSDFQPAPAREEKATLASKQPITDYVVDISWPRKDLAVQMDFVYAVIFNCESGARMTGDTVQQSVWKLRELHLVNATDERLKQGFKTPPPELQDKWTIKKMSMARREPRKGP
jgi:hypothetical protein